jgi:hypothetical protein
MAHIKTQNYTKFHVRICISFANLATIKVQRPSRNTDCVLDLLAEPLAEGVVEDERVRARARAPHASVLGHVLRVQAEPGPHLL